MEWMDHILTLNLLPCNYRALMYVALTFKRATFRCPRSLFRSSVKKCALSGQRVVVR
jgi:hypothetical protein